MFLKSCLASGQICCTCLAIAAVEDPAGRATPPGNLCHVCADPVCSCGLPLPLMTWQDLSRQTFDNLALIWLAGRALQTPAS